MNFSLILNSRGRPKYLENLLDSIIKTTADISSLETIIKLDNDDFETGAWLEKNIEKYLHFTSWLNGPRPDNLHLSLNELARHAKGRFVWVINDDCEITTQNWDTIAMKYIYDYKYEKNISDDIIYLATSDNSCDKMGEYSSFPIIGKEAVDLLDFVMYSDFCGLGGDTTIYKLYKSIDRICDCKSINVRHLTHETLISVMSPDETARHVRDNTNKNYVNPFEFDVSKESKILLDYINGK